MKDVRGSDIASTKLVYLGLAYMYEGHFYVRRIGLYLYKYRIYGTITIYILKGLAFVYQLV